jgi:4-carboxymuconolactone decarboxylase
MSRLHRPTPEELTVEQLPLYLTLTSGRRSTGDQPTPLTDADGRLEGPFNAMLLNPTIGDALQHLGEAIRFGGRLPARSREIAILAVAAHHACDFEQRAHEPLGAAAGLTAAELGAIATGADLTLRDPRESVVLNTTRTLLETGTLDADAYDTAVQVLGEGRLFELTTLIGYYSLLAMQMSAFDVH